MLAVKYSTQRRDCCPPLSRFYLAYLLSSSLTQDFLGSFPVSSKLKYFIYINILINIYIYINYYYMYINY